MSSDTKAFNQGYDDYYKGRGEEHNPYDLTTDEHLSWNDGWLAAQAEEEDEA